METNNERRAWIAERIVSIVMEETQRHGDGEDARQAAIVRINVVLERWLTDQVRRTAERTMRSLSEQLTGPPPSPAENLRLHGGSS